MEFSLTALYRFWTGTRTIVLRGIIYFPANFFGVHARYPFVVLERELQKDTVLFFAVFRPNGANGKISKKS